MRLSKLDVQTILDPWQFFALLSITDKLGRLRKLVLNAEQVRIIQSLLSGVDVLVLKPRQIGSSTAVAAYYFWLTYTSPEPTTHVVLSHKLASAKHIFSMFPRFHANLPKRFQRELSVCTTTQLTFADSGATIKAESSGADGGLRSFTASTCHISEFAFSPNAAELKATAIAALNGGQLCIESTANHYGDSMHTEVGLFESGEVKGDFIFFPWTEHEEYTETPPKDFTPNPSSMLTEGQQAWRKTMIGKLGESKFQREYPTTFAEAYAQLDGAWLTDAALAHLTVLRLPVEGGALAKPERGEKYAIGVDAGAGTGGDFSVVVVVSVRTGQIVEIRRSNTIAPSPWAMQVADASKKWNGAKVLVESNGTWGGVIVTELRHLSVPQWMDGDDKYWTTDGATKPKMLEHLKDALTSGRVHTLDARTLEEVRSFQIDDRGMPYCPRVGGHHGDSVIALALALQCADSIKLSSQPFLPQWLRDQKTQKALRAAGGADHRRY